MKKKLLCFLFFVTFISAKVFSQPFQDTLRYAQAKESILGTNTYNFLDIWQVDNEAITQTFLLGDASLTIKGIEFYGSNNKSKGTSSVTIRASVYTVDANYTPATKLASGDVVISSADPNYYYVFFSTPINVSSNYAVVLEAVSSKGVFSVYVTNAVANQSYDELFTRFKSSYYTKSKGAYISIPTLTTADPSNWPAGPHNFDALLAPVISYELSSEAAVSTTSVCVNTAVECTGTSGPDAILGNRMLNYQAFRKYFGTASADSSFIWEMGDGPNYVYGKTHSYTYKTPGTYTATYYTGCGFWGWHTASASKTIEVFVNPAPAINTQPANTEVSEGGNTSFSIDAPGATAYRWQVKKDAAFVDVQNGSLYSGTDSKKLTVTGVREKMSGYVYRCVIKGGCSLEGNSDEAKLTVKVGEPQAISFTLTEEWIYGTTAFDPGAVSDAGLPVAYSSSNTDVATIENGRILIKKTGVTTITATQSGNETYSAAEPVSQKITVVPRPVTLSLTNSTAIAKVYDKNKEASLAAANYVLDGVMNHDDVTVTGSAEYADVKVGTEKLVTVDNLMLGGDDKDNYKLTTTSATTNGSITPKPINALFKSIPGIKKVYDGTNTATLQEENLEITGVIRNDEVLLKGTAEYNDQHAGFDKTVYFRQVILAGEDA